MNSPLITKAKQIGGKRLHGVETAGALSFDNSSHVVTVATGIVYWYQGQRRENSGSTTCDLDSYVTLTNNTLYYVSFDDASGTLKASADAWSLTDNVPVCAVYWNGTAGALLNELHQYDRNIIEHAWMHKTVGSRISPADFAQLFPSSAAAWTPASHYNAGGTVNDDGLETSIGSQSGTGSKFRVFYEISPGGKFTFVDSDYPYPTNVSYVDKNNSYTLTDVGTSEYINVWLYAAPDMSGRIYCFVESVNDPYNTVALARAASPPNLASVGITPELKLLYRIILRGNETYYENTDYRSSASLPAGGASAPPTASAIALTPAGGISATNVQAGIEELDSEKIGSAGVTYEALSANSDIGTGSTQVSQGDHTHAYLPTAGGTLTGDLQLGEVSIKLDEDLSADEKWSGIVVAGTLGDTISAGHLCYLNNDDGRWEKADANLSDGYDKVLGICLSGGSDGSSSTLLLWGRVRSASFPTFTTGNKLFMSETAGEITHTAPTTADSATRIVGFALDADDMLFCPSPNYHTHT